MKIIRLLRQCLGIRNARRSKRRSLARSKSVGEVCIASLDLPLETRLLLSATGGSVDDAVAANVEIADLQRQVTSISVSTEATLNGSVDPVTGTLTIEIASNDEAAFSFVPELDIASPLASDSFSLHWQSSNQIVTGLFDFGGRLPNSLSTANGSFIKLPLDVSLRTSDSFSDSIGHDNFNVNARFFFA